MEISSPLTSQFETILVNPGSTTDLKEEVSQLRSYIAENHKVLIEQEQEKVKNKLDLSQTIQDLRSQTRWIQEYSVPYQVYCQNMAEMRNELYEFYNQSIKDRNQVLDRFQEAVTCMETFYAGSIQEQQRLSQNQNFNDLDQKRPCPGISTSAPPAPPVPVNSDRKRCTLCNNSLQPNLPAAPASPLPPIIDMHMHIDLMFSKLPPCPMEAQSLGLL